MMSLLSPFFSLAQGVEDALPAGVPYLDIAHAIAVARELQQVSDPQPMLQALVCFLVSTLGGSSLGAIILGQPIAWLSYDSIVFTYVAVFLVSYLPVTRGWFSKITNAPYLSTFFTFWDDLSWAAAVETGVMRAIKPVHSGVPIRNSASAAILLGALGGTGGSALRGLFSLHKREWKLAVPRHLSDPHLAMKLSVAASVLFYLLVDEHSHLPDTVFTDFTQQQAKWITMAFVVGISTVWYSMGVGAMIKKNLPSVGGKAKAVNNAPAASTSKSTNGADEDEDSAPSKSGSAKKRKTGRSASKKGH